MSGVLPSDVLMSYTRHSLVGVLPPLQRRTRRILQRHLASEFTAKLVQCLSFLVGRNQLSRKQHPTKHQLYSHLLLIPLTTQIRRGRHVGHCMQSGWLVGWIFWHINQSRSFNAKFCLYIHTYSTKDFKTNIKIGKIF